MKRILSVILLLVLMLSLSACGEKSAEAAVTTDQGTDAEKAQGTNVTESTVMEEENAATETDAPVVYFTADISPAGLQKVYEALNWTPGGKLAVKVSTGEPPASNYLRLQKQLCHAPTGGRRSRLYIFCRIRSYG